MTTERRLVETFPSYEEFLASAQSLTENDLCSDLPTSMSPRLATEILAADPRNRKERPSKVRKYARLMAAGKWNAAISEPLMLLPSGQLANGQHRLKAIVMSGVTIEVRVIRVSSTLGTDEGVPRTLADELVLSGAVTRRQATLVAKVTEQIYPEEGPSLEERLIFFRANRELIMSSVELPTSWLEGKDRIRREMIPVRLLAICRARAIFLDHLPADLVDPLLADIVEGGITNEKAKIIYEHLYEVHRRHQPSVSPKLLAGAVRRLLAIAPGERIRNPFDRPRRLRRVA